MKIRTPIFQILRLFCVVLNLFNALSGQIATGFNKAAGVVGNSQVYDNGTNIGIGTITPKVTLDIEGDAASTTVLDGMIPPRLTGDQLRAKTYSTDQTGAMVYITAADSAPTGQTANVDTVGYFYFNGTVWNPMSLNVNTTVCEIFDQVGGQLIDEGIFSEKPLQKKISIKIMPKIFIRD